MAEQSQNPGAVTNSFTKGMVKDFNDTFVGEGLWSHARNAVNNSHEGQVGVIGNEPANLHCVTLPYDLIGAILITGDQWAIFTTDDVNSEIGIFDESKCTYTKVVNDSCLNFKRTNLITGISRRRYDCERPVYWADGLNPDRFMDLDNPPYKTQDVLVDECIIKKELVPRQLDCEQIRIAALIKQPCLLLRQGKTAGSLLNGSYQVALAYTINGVRVTDYLGLSEVQSLFTHENVNSSLELIITSIDSTFDEFELVLIARVNEQTFARKIGDYSTAQGTIYIDRIDFESPTIPIQNIVLRTEPIEKSDAIYTVNNYALRVGTYSKFKFNYQKQANKIKAKWVAVEYPSEYYIKNGNNTGYLRDEQYSFFIRWVYNTGERSESYHIPGREAITSELQSVYGGDAFENADGVQKQKWQVENTASVDSATSYTLTDGGRVIATGNMGYWESTELYPNNFDIWGNLCGKPIRHHKMPDVTINGGNIINHFNSNGRNIVILGVQFENVTVPLDQNGNPISSIVGYEILRGSRQGNKSIMAKGMFNNMREYDVPGNTTVKGLYQNYPYNDLRSDIYLSSKKRISGDGTANVTNSSSPQLTNFRTDVFSFHSPEVSFTNPFLNVDEVKIYQELSGTAYGQFEIPFRHPKFKVLTNFASIIAKLVGIVSTLDMIANGVEIGATEDFPVGRRIGPIPLWSFNPNTFPIVGTSSGGGSTPGATANNTFGTIWNATLGAISAISAIANIITTAKTLTELQTEKMYTLLKLLVPKRQYAVQYNSHGFYNNSVVSTSGNRRRKIKDAAYIAGSNLQYFGTEYQVNNIYRSSALILQLDGNLANPVSIDNSRETISSSNKSLYERFSTNIASHYGALKFAIPSQYGQLEGIKQLPISFCINLTAPDKTKTFETGVLFGGDTYINRYTEKNTMFFFTNWLMGELDEVEFDYTEYINVPWPRFWIHNTQQHSAFLKLAEDFRALDARKSSGINVTRGYFYLFNSGVRDFFVESEVNLAYRDWEDDISKRHYDPFRFTDLSTMFRSDIIKSGNYYKYDYSLSISKLFNSQITWGQLLPRDYDPIVSEKCYTYRPNRVIYSQQQQDNSKEDAWRIYLVNNYRDFPTRVTVIKSINATGALFMLKDRSPEVFLGEEQLKMDGTGAVISIGDGNLFSQNGQLRSIVNADRSYEYGSCQSKYAHVGNVYGVFWVSQEQGKVLHYAGGIKEISRDGMKYWFAKYLPSELLKVYPDYSLADNPLVGIGVQMIYDNTNEIIYITKKDYKPKRKDLLHDDKGFYTITGYTTVTTPGSTTLTCPTGYELVDGTCLKTETATPIQSGTVTYLTRTPFQAYGNAGTRVYNTLDLNASYTLLNTSNPFWIRSANPAGWDFYTPEQQQAFDLNNGPVNRLAVWGLRLNGAGQPLNNYNTPNTSSPNWTSSGASSSGQVITVPSTTGLAVGLNILVVSFGTGSLFGNTRVTEIISPTQFRISINPASPLSNASIIGYYSDIPPVNEWIGFDVCINITQTKTYHVCIAGDNKYRLSLDGTVILSQENTSTTNFTFLHIFPVTIQAGSHILRLEGWNNEAQAGFACEVFDLSSIPSGTTVVDYLNQQTNYDNLESKVIFTTRTATTFSSNLYTCPAGYIFGNPTCDLPICQKLNVQQPTSVVVPSKSVQVPNKLYIPFDDATAWEDASWTISYDPKSKTWVSFHDWKPTFLIPGKNHFMSVNKNSIWKHNVRCDLFCNFYNTNYPFEVEFISSTGQQVTSMRNIEYMLETYRYYNDCADKFHILDQNFDQSIVYNSEQISGLLELNLKSKTNPVSMLSYPQIQSNSIKILFSKEEQKYRFNQFWDITKDRGEFNSVTTSMFITKPNGYEYTINPAYINYQKAPLERKKFRHVVNRVLLRRLNSGDVKFLFKLSNQKVLQSPR